MRFSPLLESEAMTAMDQLDDDDLRIELAGFLSWYGIARDAKGILTGKLPGVRPLVPLAIPDWTSNRRQVQGLENSLDRKGLMAGYAHNLLMIRRDAGADESGASRALAVATPRQRCEAALVTLREAVGRHEPRVLPISGNDDAPVAHAKARGFETPPRR